MFTNEQIEFLQAPLKRENVKSREQSGRKLSYIEGWKAIEEANRIFGFDAWTSVTAETRMVAERQRKIGQGDRMKDGWGVSYIAKVRVAIGDLVREGVGAGHGIDVDLGLAHESAIKEAETDARKRALMTFGYPFGLALYDKTQENVETAAPPPRQELPREQAPRDTRPAPAAPQRQAGSISDRAAVPRVTSGPQRQEQPTPFDDLPPSNDAVAMAKEIRSLKSLKDLDALKRTPEFQEFWHRTNTADRAEVMQAVDKLKSAYAADLIAAE